MSTPHNRAEMGDFARTVLMPGDPLRAQFIAETFLESPRLVTDVRGMLGYTGTYQGRPVSVMGSGMGMPSIGIYSYELYTRYGVENIIRIGSAGSYTDKARLFDVVLADGAYSESNYAVTQSGDREEIQRPSAALNEALRRSAAEQNIPLIEGIIHSSDVFYREPSDAKPTYWERLRDEKGCLCVEMESFALFLGQLRLARDHHRRTAPDQLHRHDEGRAGGAAVSAPMPRDQAAALIRAAFAGRRFAYAPYSHFAVGAALLAKDGRVFTGCNIENAGYTPTNCAERTALFKAVSEGVTEFSAIAVVGSLQGKRNELPTGPCGVCRQALFEFTGPDLVVLMAKSEDDYIETTLGALLPYGFGPKNLEIDPSRPND